MLKNLKYEDIPDIFYALFLGGIILGIVCAAVSYFAVSWSVEKLQKKRGGI